MTTLPPYHNMTPIQRATMVFIVEHIKAMGQSPTLEEIAAIQGREVPNVHKTVKRLIELGYLKKEPNVHRGVTPA